MSAILTTRQSSAVKNPLQVTCDEKADLPVPGQKFTFGVVKTLSDAFKNVLA